MKTNEEEYNVYYCNECGEPYASCGGINCKAERLGICYYCNECGEPYASCGGNH